MQYIKKHEIRSEYFDRKLWPIAGINDPEKEELMLLSRLRTSTDETHQCSERAHYILMAAFAKINMVLAKKGYEYDLVELAGHEGLFARNKTTGDIKYRVPVDDKVPGK